MPHRPPRSPRTASSRARLHRASCFVVFALALGLATGCGDKKSEAEASSATTTTTTTRPQAPQDEPAPHSGEPASARADDLAPDSPEVRFLNVLDAFATVLESTSDTASVVSAFEAHYRANQADIIAAAKALHERKAALSEAEQDALEDRLAQRAEANAFLEAFEGFQRRASPDQFKRVEDIMLEIYETAGAAGD